MKKVITLILAVGTLCSAYSQNTAYHDRMEHIFGNINKAKVTTGYLKEFGIRFNDVESFNGTITPNNEMDKTRWHSLYTSLYTMRVGNVAAAMAAPSTLLASLQTQNSSNSTGSSGTILLAVQHYNYQQYKTNALTNGDVTITNERIYDVAGRNPYETKTAFAAMPLQQSAKRETNSFTFKLPSTLVYTNSSLVLNQVQVDFGNGIGYQVVQLDTPKTITYPSSGEKVLKVKFLYAGGSTLESHFKMQVEYPRGPKAPLAKFDGTGASNTIRVGEPYLGASASGLVTVELAPGHTQLTKPLIVVEGFDPDNSFNYEKFFSSSALGGINAPITLIPLTTLNEAIENEHYDLVFVDFLNGTDYIQRNAYMVENVIEWVNANKVGNEKNVVMGMSMGGLVARYALRHMEQTGRIHETKLYVSHDAPHQGANIPLSLQAFVRHMAGEEISLPIFFSLFDIEIMDITELIPELQNGLSLLQTPAAQQMLIYQLQNTGTAVSIDNSTPYHDFAAEYHNMGYPQQDNIRNIAIANGSECGTKQGFEAYDPLVSINQKVEFGYFGSVISAIINYFSVNPGKLLTSIFSTSTDVKAEFNLRALPNQQANQIYRGEVYIQKTILWTITVNESLIGGKALNASSAMLPMDNVGGGFYDVNNFQGYSLGI